MYDGVRDCKSRGFQYAHTTVEGTFTTYLFFLGVHGVICGDVNASGMVQRALLGNDCCVPVAQFIHVFVITP